MVHSGTGRNVEEDERIVPRRDHFLHSVTVSRFEEMEHSTPFWTPVFGQVVDESHLAIRAVAVCGEEISVRVPGGEELHTVGHWNVSYLCHEPVDLWSRQVSPELTFYAGTVLDVVVHGPPKDVGELRIGEGLASYGFFLSYEVSVLLRIVAVVHLILAVRRWPCAHAPPPLGHAFIEMVKDAIGVFWEEKIVNDHEPFFEEFVLELSLVEIGVEHIKREKLWPLPL